MVFNNVDVSNFDFITSGNNIDFDGIIDGLVGLSGLSEHLNFFSNIEIGQLFINKQEVGNVSVNTSWNDQLKAIHTNTEIFKVNNYNEKIKSVDLNGYYFTQKKSEDGAEKKNDEAVSEEKVSDNSAEAEEKKEEEKTDDKSKK